MKRVHHENSPGQNEIELDFDDAIKNADAMVKGMQVYFL
jgi:glutamine synthetase